MGAFDNEVMNPDDTLCFCVPRAELWTRHFDVLEPVSFQFAPF
jgi:hypothetical protein